MFSAMNYAAVYCKIKVDSWFRRVFKEQAGGAELIATLVIIGIVLILAFAFKDKLSNLVKQLWNSLIKDGNDIKSTSEIEGIEW